MNADAGFAAELKKRKLRLIPSKGVDLQKVVKEAMTATTPEVVSFVRKAILSKKKFDRVIVAHDYLSNMQTLGTTAPCSSLFWSDRSDADTTHTRQTVARYPGLRLLKLSHVLGIVIMSGS